MDPKKVAKGLEVVGKLKDAFEGVKEIVSEFVENVEDKIVREPKEEEIKNADVNDKVIIIDGADLIQETINIDGIEIRIKNHSGHVSINVTGAQNISSVKGDIYNEGSVNTLNNVHGDTKVVGDVGTLNNVHGNVKF